jgi:NAD(P)H-hydrate epimerase
MERAAEACVHWILTAQNGFENYIVFCGPGNNGGDGLAIARLLLEAGKTVVAFRLEAKKYSDDFTVNLERFEALYGRIHILKSAADFGKLPSDSLVIDALFGSGLNRPLEGLAAQIIDKLNHSKASVLSIDIPSGLFTDSSSVGHSVIKANYTLSFQVPKYAFMMTENAQYCGEVNVLDIGLHPKFEMTHQAPQQLIDADLIEKIYTKRNPAAHKYQFGHALLLAGSNAYMGAAILAAKACLRSGCGLVTVATEQGRESIVQTAFPEAITTAEQNSGILLKKKAAVGIGPGWASSVENQRQLQSFIHQSEIPLVIDATALELLKPFLHELNSNVTAPLILTPHRGEFDALFEGSTNDFESAILAVEKSTLHHCYIVLKGYRTMVACPDGTVFFNSTGNSGMATAGCGDVLTGILTGLLASGYKAKEACILGVYLHGLSGDFAALDASEEAIIASDIIKNLGQAFQELSGI